LFEGAIFKSPHFDFAKCNAFSNYRNSTLSH